MGIGDMLQAQQDAEDAARYRWLRDSAGNGVMRKLMKECRPEGWDALVDRDRHGTRRGVPSGHEFDEHGKCKWCPETVNEQSS